MKKTGKVYSITKGVYTFNKDEMVSGFGYAPFYYGLLSALTIRDLWTQNSRPVVMTIKRVRKSRVKIFDDKNDAVFLHHIPVKYFFGFDIIKYGRFMLPVSDPEKTIIDLFYYRTRLAPQNYDGLLRAVKRSKLTEYLKRYDNHTRASVMNFVKKYKPLADSGKLENPY
jgi:predicted transcriptional regulator of viral defense system